jgi:hypothetical protein
MESIGFTYKKKIIANFHVLGLFKPPVLSAIKLKFWLQASFEPTWCTSFSEFRNLEIPLKTQE